MTITNINAVTLAVRDMARAVDFYDKLGLEMAYGGGDAGFTSYKLGEDFLNLILAPAHAGNWWGRVIIRVEGVDAIYAELKKQGLEPDAPRDAEWGERYFHIKDPDGHELSFAQLLSQGRARSG